MKKFKANSVIRSQMDCCRLFVQVDRRIIIDVTNYFEAKQQTRCQQKVASCWEANQQTKRKTLRSDERFGF